MNFGYVTENGVNSNNRRTAFYKLIFISLYNKIIADIYNKVKGSSRTKDGTEKSLK